MEDFSPICYVTVGGRSEVIVRKGDLKNFKLSITKRLNVPEDFEDVIMVM